MKLMIRSMLVLLCLLCLTSWANVPSLQAQGVTGQISGTVVDQSGAVIAGAKVTLAYTLNNQVREVTSGSGGEFLFTDLIPGTYSLSINASGFQPYKQNEISVTTSERVA